MEKTDYDRELTQKIASKFKTIRINLGLKVTTVYLATHVNVGRVEAGKTEIRFLTAAALCEYYNVPLSDFFDGIMNV